MKLSSSALVLLTLVCSAALARGPSPYLPHDLPYALEQDIQRVLVLADETMLVRPIAAAAVLDALPRACGVDAPLCQRVRSYLNGYMRRAGLHTAGVEVAAHSDAVWPIPNARGAELDESWIGYAQAYWQPHDYILLQAGGYAYDERGEPTGSLLSIGFEAAQLDVGWRDLWLSPFRHSAMLVSTQAPTMPSITLSNYAPLTSFGLRYQFFMAEMSESSLIAFEDGFTQGNPRLGGLHVSMSPAYGWSLGANRLLQFGGGERSSSFSDFLDAFFNPSQADNTDEGEDPSGEFGNQLASFTSQLIVPWRTPFTIYFEYAGEDTSKGENFRLGNSALSIGVHVPRLWGQFDLTYETSEWQNGWYVNRNYGDGLTNEGYVIGHWGATQRLPGDAVGAQTHELWLGWTPQFGGRFEFGLRTLENEDYGAGDYERAYQGQVRYSRMIDDFSVGLEAVSGRDVFGEDGSRFAAFVRYAPGYGAPDFRDVEMATAERGAEVFVDAGLSYMQADLEVQNEVPKETFEWEASPHIAVGARRAVAPRHDLGARVELTEVADAAFLAVRAIDYRYRAGEHFAFGGFFGAARYDVATPAYGYYLGFGAQWRDLAPRLDLNLDLRIAEKVARDKLLPTDPGGARPDVFYDIYGATIYASYRW